MQVQHHGLLGDRGPPPLDLGPRRLQLGRLDAAPGRPGTDAARASSAPCLAVRQICTTVERSTPNFSAASRWVACWARTWTNISYFSDRASRLRALRTGPGLGSAMCSNLLKGDQRTRLVAGF
jgi:hypothetical protein